MMVLSENINYYMYMLDRHDGHVPYTQVLSTSTEATCELGVSRTTVAIIQVKKKSFEK